MRKTAPCFVVGSLLSSFLWLLLVLCLLSLGTRSVHFVWIAHRQPAPPPVWFVNMALGSAVVAENKHQISVYKVVMCASTARASRDQICMFCKAWVLLLATTNPLKRSWATTACRVNNSHRSVVGQWLFQVSAYKNAALNSFFFFKIWHIPFPKRGIPIARPILVPFHFL